MCEQGYYCLAVRGLLLKIVDVSIAQTLNPLSTPCCGAITPRHPLPAEPSRHACCVSVRMFAVDQLLPMCAPDMRAGMATAITRSDSRC